MHAISAVAALSGLWLATPLQAQTVFPCDVTTSDCVDVAFGSLHTGRKTTYDLSKPNADFGDFTSDMSRIPVWDQAKGAYRFEIAATSVDPPIMQSNWRVFYGKVTIDIMAAPGQGVVNAFTLVSDVGDEADWEIMGKNSVTAETAYFGKGIPDYSRPLPGINPPWDPSRSTTGEFTKYEIEYRPDTIIWSINGQKEQQVWPQNSTFAGRPWPDTPMALRLGPWMAQSVGWAGGSPDFTTTSMYVRSIEVEEYSAAAQYSWDTSGSSPKLVTQGKDKDGNGPQIFAAGAVVPVVVSSTTSASPQVSSQPIRQVQAVSMEAGSADSNPTEIAVSGCTTHITNSAAFNALPTAHLTVWNTAATKETVTSYAGQLVGWDNRGLPFTWLPNAGYIACNTFTPPKPASSSSNPNPNNNKRRQLIPGAVAQSWSATTQCYTQTNNAAQFAALRYTPTTFWNDNGALVTGSAVVGARTSWDNNGFPVTILPGGAGQMYCTTSVDYAVEDYTPSVADTWSPLQTAAPAAGGAGDTALVGFSTLAGPAAATGTGSDAAGFQSAASRFGLSDPVVVAMVLGSCAVGVLGVVAVL